MTKDQTRIKLYHCNAANRKLRSRMTNSLQLTRKGEFEQAERMLAQTRREFEMLRQEHQELLKEPSRSTISEAEKSLGFTELFHDSIVQANRLHSKKCSAVKFHVYN